MNIGDLVRLTGDGVIAAWYPGLDHDAVGVVIVLPDPPDNREWVTVRWPRGKDTHVLYDLEIIKSFS